jgi:hypothetical protein
LLGLRFRIPPEALDGCLSWLLCVSALGRSVVQKSPTEYGEYECDRVDSIMRGPRPTRASVSMEANKTDHFSLPRQDHSTSASYPIIRHRHSALWAGDSVIK